MSGWQEERTGSDPIEEGLEPKATPPTVIILILLPPRREKLMTVQKEEMEQ